MHCMHNMYIYIYIYTHIVCVYIYIYIYIYTCYGVGAGLIQRAHVRGGDDTVDRDTVGSNCSIENCLSTSKKINKLEQLELSKFELDEGFHLYRPPFRNAWCDKCKSVPISF